MPLGVKLNRSLFCIDLTQRSNIHNASSWTCHSNYSSLVGQKINVAMQPEVLNGRDLQFM
jgi:hypothetical protein